MATDPLTLIARSSGASAVTASHLAHSCQSWQHLLLAEDSEQIWLKIFRLLSTIPNPGRADLDSLTQEVFLQLLASDRTTRYLEQGLSEEEISEDLLTLIT